MRRLPRTQKNGKKKKLCFIGKSFSSFLGRKKLFPLPLSYCFAESNCCHPGSLQKIICRLYCLLVSATRVPSFAKKNGERKGRLCACIFCKHESGKSWLPSLFCPSFPLLPPPAVSLLFSPLSSGISQGLSFPPPSLFSFFSSPVYSPAVKDIERKKIGREKMSLKKRGQITR